MCLKIFNFGSILMILVIIGILIPIATGEIIPKVESARAISATPLPQLRINPSQQIVDISGELSKVEKIKEVCCRPSDPAGTRRPR